MKLSVDGGRGGAKLPGELSLWYPELHLLCHVFGLLVVELALPSLVFAFLFGFFNSFPLSFLDFGPIKLGNSGDDG